MAWEAELAQARDAAANATADRARADASAAADRATADAAAAATLVAFEEEKKEIQVRTYARVM